jgi:hypothetical protein
MEIKMMSLFDYLGRPAGGELGKQVYNAAYQLKVPVETRHVSNRKYTGEVMLYPEAFLKEYFEMKQNG